MQCFFIAGSVNPALHRSVKINMIWLVQSKLCWVSVRNFTQIKRMKITQLSFVLTIPCGKEDIEMKWHNSKSHWWGSEVRLSMSLTQWICDRYLHNLLDFFRINLQKLPVTPLHLFEVWASAAPGSSQCSFEPLRKITDHDDGTACIENCRHTPPWLHDYRNSLFSLLSAALTGNS